MPRLALNFICKNEARVIHNMLVSAAPITDLIVAVDTGSTDNTIAIIQAFGVSKGIPTYVFERPFDNFCNSRNFALDKLREVVSILGWPLNDTWGFFVDCDEMARIASGFQKEDIDKDFHFVTAYTDSGSFQRDMFFHLSKKLWWEGPIHELLVWEDADITHGPALNICIEYGTSGASWRGSQEEKFLRYARLLSEYVEEGHAEFRWVYYTGSSYATAAENCKSKIRRRKWALLAKKYYEWATRLPVHTVDEPILLRRRLAMIKIMLNESAFEIHSLLLSAYKLDPRRAEALSDLITWHQSAKRWQTAYIFSSMAKNTFHGHLPKGNNMAELENPLYLWKLLVLHFISCWRLGLKVEGLQTRLLLKDCIEQHPKYFTLRDLVYIRSNTPFYLALRSIFSWVNSFRPRREISLEIL